MMELKEAKQFLNQNGFYLTEAAQKEFVILDTKATPSLADVRDWEDDDSIEEDSEEYWDVVNRMKEVDIEDFTQDASFDFDLGECLVTVSYGLWNGNERGARVVDISTGDDLLKLLNKDIDEVKIVINEDGLVVYGYHHDGTNVYNIYKINERGKKYWDNHEDDEDIEKVFNALFYGKMVKKITKEMIGW